MNIYFYIFTEKVHQYDAQRIMTGGLFSYTSERASAWCLRYPHSLWSGISENNVSAYRTS